MQISRHSRANWRGLNRRVIAIVSKGRAPPFPRPRVFIARRDPRVLFARSLFVRALSLPLCLFNIPRVIRVARFYNSYVRAMATTATTAATARPQRGAPVN